MVFTWKIEKFLKNGAFELEKFLNFPSKNFRGKFSHKTLVLVRVTSLRRNAEAEPLVDPASAQNSFAAL